MKSKMRGHDNAAAKREKLILDKLEGMNQRMNEIEASRQLQMSPRNHMLDAMPQDYVNSISDKVSPGKKNMHEPQYSSYNNIPKAHEIEELSFVISGLQTKFSDSQDEVMRVSMKLDAESKERRKLEQRNNELNSKLSEARQGLRGAQSSLQSVQQATEQLSLKRDQRDLQLQRTLSENRTFEAKVFELETKLRDAESSTKTIMQTRDEVVMRLQEQLNTSKENLFKLQSEVVRGRSEKTLVDAEVDALRRKVQATEARSKMSEDSISSSYQSEITSIEDQLRSVTEKMEEYKVYESKCDDLTQELRSRTIELKAYQNKIYELEMCKKDGENRVLAIESQVRLYESQVKQADTRSLTSEQDRIATETELAMLKKSSLHSESLLKEYGDKLSRMTGEKEELVAAVDALQKRIEDGDSPEAVKKMTKELQRSKIKVDSALKQNENLQRQLQFAIDENNRKDESSRSSATKVQDLSVTLGESKQQLSLANLRITELTAELSRVNEKIAAARARRDNTGSEKNRGSDGTSSSGSSAAKALGGVEAVPDSSAWKPTPPVGQKPSSGSSPQRSGSVAQVANLQHHMLLKAKKAKANIQEFDEGAEAASELPDSSRRGKITKQQQKEIAKAENEALAEFDTDDLAGNVAGLRIAKKKLKKDINAWQKSFSLEHGREPTVEDKSECRGNMYHIYAKLNGMLKDKEDKLAVLEGKNIAVE